jgi:hypothetical protein
VARTKKQIEQSIAADIEEQDPTMDTVKGPIPEIFIRPQAKQFRNFEIKIDDLNKRYSLDYIRTTNTASLELYGANHGLRKSPGRAASGYVYFFTFSRLNSGENIIIPAGVVVSTADVTISYQTTAEAVIIGDSIESYYSVSRRRYEVRVPIASLGTGDIYEIPAGRIRNIKSSVSGLDGVENREAIRGSREAESNESFGNHIQAKFNGTALGSGDGLRQLVMNFDTTRILDAKMVFSSDQLLFRRRTRRAAWDIYLIGEDSHSVEDTFIGNGTQREFILLGQPVLDVTSVTINGLSIAYSLVRDTSDQTKLSTRATDKVIFASAPVMYDTIEISYNYDRLPRDTQNYIEQIQTNLYDSDSLVRQAFKAYISISVSIQILSSFDEAQAIADTLSVIQDFTNIDSFVEILYPDRLRDKISAEVGGISGVNITEFTRLDTGTLPVEAVEFRANEYPVVLDENITITPRR